MIRSLPLAVLTRARGGSPGWQPAWIVRAPLLLMDVTQSRFMRQGYFRSPLCGTKGDRRRGSLVEMKKPGGFLLSHATAVIRGSVISNQRSDDVRTTHSAML